MLRPQIATAIQIASDMMPARFAAAGSGASGGSSRTFGAVKTLEQRDVDQAERDQRKLHLEHAIHDHVACLGGEQHRAGEQRGRETPA